MQRVFGYLNMQMLEQSELLGIRRAKRYIKALSYICTDHIDTYSEISMILSNLNNMICNVHNQITEFEGKYPKSILS